MKDLALAREKIVLDAEAQHGFEMAAQDGGGDEVGDLGGFVAAVLDQVQRVEAQLLARGLFFGGPFAVPLRGAGVEVPAVVVNALAFAGEAVNKCANFGGRFLFEMQKSDHDVGDLDAGVVDVVLHVDFVAGGAEKTHKCVAENGVAQMADVRGFVGIDGGMLNERMPLRRWRVCSRRGQRGGLRLRGQGRR